MGIKEASGNMSYTAKIAKHVSEDFALYSGNDDIIIPTMALGGSGVISVLANCLPKETHDMVYDYLNGDTKSATESQLKHLDFVNALFCEVNPVPVKAALNLMGMNVGGYRLPLCEMDPKNLEHLKATMKDLKII